MIVPKVFSLAWLLACRKSFASVVSGVVGLLYTPGRRRERLRKRKLSHTTEKTLLAG